MKRDNIKGFNFTSLKSTLFTWNKMLQRTRPQTTSSSRARSNFRLTSDPLMRGGRLAARGARKAECHCPFSTDSQAGTLAWESRAPSSRGELPRKFSCMPFSWAPVTSDGHARCRGGKGIAVPPALPARK